MFDKDHFIKILGPEKLSLVHISRKSAYKQLIEDVKKMNYPLTISAIKFLVHKYYEDKILNFMDAFKIDIPEIKKFIGDALDYDAKIKAEENKKIVEAQKLEEEIKKFKSEASKYSEGMRKLLEKINKTSVGSSNYNALMTVLSYFQ